MKSLSIVLFATLAWASCQNNPDLNTSGTSTADQDKQIAAPKDLKEMKELAAKKGVEVSESDIVGNAIGPINGTINGRNVSFRKAASIKSEKMGTFEDKEPVSVLGSVNVENEGEAILSKSITVKGDGGTVNLPKGKAVIVEDYQSGNNTYLVTYEDPQKGKLSAKIDASAAETITFASWSQVKRTNGEIGWVLGKYLKTN